MTFLSYEEQAIIKMYHFESKEELVEKLKESLKESLKEIEEEEMKEIVENLIPKIDTFSLEELKDVDNIFE